MASGKWMHALRQVFWRLVNSIGGADSNGDGFAGLGLGRKDVRTRTYAPQIRLSPGYNVHQSRRDLSKSKPAVVVRGGSVGRVFHSQAALTRFGAEGQAYLTTASGLFILEPDAFQAGPSF